MMSEDMKTANSFKIVGYYQGVKIEKSNRIQFNVITNLIYAFAIPNIDGTIKELEFPENAKALINEAHKNNVKISIAVGGWSYEGVPLEPVFKEATATEIKRRLLVSEIMHMVHEFGFDGVDIDWEHPRFQKSSQDQYEALILDLRRELDKENKLLTAAVLSGVSPDGKVMEDAAAHTDKVLNAVDWINVMAYDGGDGQQHSSYQFAVDCGEYWKSTRKMAREKIVLGVPFYGRPTWSSYETLLRQNPDAYKKDTQEIRGSTAYYNGIPTIEKKTKFAKQELGGIMIWELAQDTADLGKSLLCAIGRAALE